MRTVRVTAKGAADLYVERIQNSRARIEAGIMNVTVSPMEKAAASKAKMLANITASINNGRWERGLKRVSLEDWRKAFIEKGLDRIGTGAAAARGKMETFYEALFKKQNELLKTIDAMPDITLDQSIARMTAWVRGMAGFTY